MAALRLAVWVVTSWLFKVGGSVYIVDSGHSGDDLQESVGHLVGAPGEVVIVFFQQFQGGWFDRDDGFVQCLFRQNAQVFLATILNNVFPGEPLHVFDGRKMKLKPNKDALSQRNRASFKKLLVAPPGLEPGS